MTLPTKNKFDPQFPIVGEAGRPSQFHRNYLAALDALVAAMAAGNFPASINVAALTNAANDAAAATAGVPLHGMYRNGSVLQVRVV